MELRIRHRGIFFPKSELQYKREMIPEGGAVNVLIRLRRGFSPRLVEKSEAFGEVRIGEKGREELGLSQAYWDTFRDDPCKENRIFRISELKNAGDIEYIKNAPRIVFTGLCREGGDLMYSPLSAFDAEVFAGQRKVLYGEISEIKLFAMQCRGVGQIVCDFYNEKTQQLSEFILKYNDAEGKELPICATVECGLAKYLIVYEGCFGQNYVLQYTDAEGKKLNKKTYIVLGYYDT